MLNRILHFSLNNRLTVIVLSAVILIGGTIAMLRTDVDIFPDLNAPTVVVMTEAGGLTAEEVEKVVTYPIEAAINGATGIRRVRSQSTSGFSVVWAEFDWDTDIYHARQLVSERLAGITEQMPASVSTPELGPQSSILGEMFIIGLEADSTSLLDLRSIADRTIAPRLLAVGGVSQVSVIGGEAKEYQIRLVPDRMKAFGVSIDDVIAATEGLNDNVAGGSIYDFGNEYLVKARLNTTDVEQLAIAVVKPAEATEAPVLLSDIATIAIAGQQPRIGLAAIESRPGVIITVTKQPHAPTIELTAEIDRVLASTQPTLPADVKIHSDIFRQADFIETSISNLQEALLEGALMVIVVLLFFLMNLRTTLISLVALPMSIVISIVVLKLLGFTINTMSLGGIAIAIGSLVDDAIVDVENVYKHLRLNRSRPASERRPVLEVVYKASAEVRTPIFNSSLIIIASFLPLFFLSGIEGRMLVPLGIAFIVALIASTIVALTLTPVLCSFLLGNRSQERKLSAEPAPARWLRARYTSALAGAMKRPRLVIGATAVLFIASCAIVPFLGRGFLPRFNEGSFTINVATLPGVSIDESDKIGRLVDSILLSIPEIRTVARKTGRAELDEHSQGVNASEIEAPYVLTNRSRSEVAKEIRTRISELPGVNLEIGQPISHRIDAMLSGTESAVAIKIFGDNLGRLMAIGQQIKGVISGVEGVVDANVEMQFERPELVIVPRRELMAMYGITLPQFRNAVAVLLDGREVSRLYEEGWPYPVTLIAEPEARNGIDRLQLFTIDTPRGAVPLSEVAEIVSTTGPNSVSRENVKRRLVVSANVEDRDLRSTVQAMQEAIAANVILPENYYVTYEGQFENEARASRTLLLTSLGALLIIFMLLYGQFKSVRQSLIILVNMPLALIGGILILWLTGGELNIPAIIGFISLIGIATRNGMLLIAHYNDLSDDAEPTSTLDQLIVKGSCDRLLPIVMTALTSALALIPLAVTGGRPGNEIQSPLAIVILGGLMSSTLLNMFVVPLLYRISKKREVPTAEASESNYSK